MIISFFLYIIAATFAGIQTFSTSQVKYLDIYASGTIDVLAGSNTNLSIHSIEENCLLTPKLSGNRLTISGGRCLSRFKVTAPQGVELSIRTDRSDVNILGVKGNIDIQQQAGSITIRESLRPIHIRMAEGLLRAKDLTGDAKVWMGRGKATLHYASVQPQAAISLTTGEADGELTFPANTSVNVTPKIKFGNLINDYMPSKKPLARISLVSETGDFSVRKQSVLP